MKKFIFIAGILFWLQPALWAQNEEDVLRYSNYSISGTARSVALGGANGVLGADFTSLSTNPAGIGVYKKSEFTISPSINFGSTKSTYLGKTPDDGKNNFALGNVGFVIVGTPVDRLNSNPIKNYQFGFGINRLQDFNNRVFIEGINDQNSLLDAYLDYAGNKNPESLNQFDTRLAFDTYLIDTLQSQSPITYINAYDYLGGFTSALQQKSIETSGSMNELVLSGGMNIGDKFYFGLTFGFPYIRYQQKSTYREINQTENPDLGEFTVSEDLETKGSGFNMKLGAIVKPTSFLRIGAAFHTPTWYNNITDKWNSNTKAYYLTDGKSFPAASPYGEYKYDIKTPWRAMLSAAAILDTRGLISAEYEYVDYSNARLRPTVDLSDKNDLIKSNFTQTHNFRLGAEVNLGAMQLRAGYAYKMSPFADDINDAGVQIVSGGLGFRTAEFFVDAALSYSISNLDYYLYSSQNYTAAADLSYNNYNFILTFGYRFE